MILYITDQSYLNRIKRFLQHNYNQWRNIKVFNRSDQLVATDGQIILTDDITFVDTGGTVHYIVEQPDSRANYHYKYQNFNQLLSQFGAWTSQPAVAFSSRIIVVTSLLGGVGKSFVAQAISNQLAERGSCLLLSLFSPSRNHRQSLSDCLLSAQHNGEFSLSDYVDHTAGYDSLAGFSMAIDLVECNSDAFQQRVVNVFNNSDYHNVVVDATPISFCQAFAECADATYLLRDSRRHGEESQLLAALELDITAYNQLYNRSSLGNARHLPDMQLSTAVHSESFVDKLRVCLQEDGLLEY